MLALGEVIEKLDIRRAQVLVEAIIVETQNGEGINLGVKWENKRSDDINFIKNSDGLLNNNGWGIATTITGLTAGFIKETGMYCLALYQQIQIIIYSQLPVLLLSIIWRLNSMWVRRFQCSYQRKRQPQIRYIIQFQGNL